MTSQGIHCFEFEYHMYGFHIGRLSLHKLSGINADVDDNDFLWDHVGRIGNWWNHGSVNVSLDLGDVLVFVGHRAQAYSGDIGLDTLVLNTGQC